MKIHIQNLSIIELDIIKKAARKGSLVIQFWQLSTLPHIIAVPLTLLGLTSLFGMGRGEHQCYNHHKILV